MTTKTIGLTGVPTDFGTTRFPCGCIMGWHSVAEIAQWAPCKVHAAAPELLEALEGLINAIDKFGFTTAKHAGYFESACSAIRKARKE